MSAFVVSDFHINALVSWAEQQMGIGAVSYFWQGRGRYVREDAARVASVLFAENVRSVNTRYGEHESAHGFVYRPAAAVGLRALSPVQVIKACHCLAYQSNETDDWEATEAKAILDAIERAAIYQLPGYDRAKWALDEPTREAA